MHATILFMQSMQAKMKNFAVPGVCVAFLFLAAGTSRGEIFTLSTGGEIRGEWVNQKEQNPTRYVIQPYAGGQLTVAATIIVRVTEQAPGEIAYERLKIQHDDTVEGNWAIAEWCRENRQNDQREFHLRRILTLDTDHAEARRLLGYQQVDRRWLTKEEIMIERGMIKYKGNWMTPQQARLKEQEEKQKVAEGDWKKKVKRWNGWLSNSSKAVRAKEFLLAIRSPDAVPALIRNLESAKTYERKQIMAEALANVGTPDAVEVLVDRTVDEEDEEFRYYCLDLLGKSKPPAAADRYIELLKKSDDNRHINRAAIGLKQMGDKTAILPLIDALITQHKLKIGHGPPGQTTTTFGRGAGDNGGTSFGTSSPKVVKRWMHNESVLSALKSLSGQDFDYDVKAWREWYKNQRQAPPQINSRRDKS